MNITIAAAIRMHQILKEAEKRVFLETGIEIDLRIVQADMIMSVPAIASAVANALSIPLEDVVGETRRQHAKDARQIAMYLSRKYLKNVSFPYIGEKFNRDYSTVIASIKVVNNMISTGDEKFLKKLITAEQAVIALYDETKNNTHTA